MRAETVDNPWGRCFAVAALMAVGVLVMACSSFGGGAGPGTSTDATPSMTSRFRALFSGSDDAPAEASAAAPATKFNPANCPPVDVRVGAGTLMVAAKSDQPTAADLRYQISFNQLARECAAVGPALAMKVGVQGRVILGPACGPGQVDVPLRMAVVHEGPDPRTIATKFKRFPVNIGPGETYVSFTHVEEDLSFPMPSPAALDAYVVYVGFDEIGDPRAPAKSAKAPKAAKKAPPLR